MKRRYKRKNIAAIRIRLWNAHNMRRRRRVKDKAKYIRIQRNKRKKVKYRRERSNITYYSNHNRTLVAPSRFSLLEYPEDVIGFIDNILVYTSLIYCYRSHRMPGCIELKIVYAYFVSNLF